MISACDCTYCQLGHVKETCPTCVNSAENLADSFGFTTYPLEEDAVPNGYSDPRQLQPKKGKQPMYVILYNYERNPEEIWGAELAADSAQEALDAFMAEHAEDGKYPADIIPLAITSGFHRDENGITRLGSFLAINPPEKKATVATKLWRNK